MTPQDRVEGIVTCEKCGTFYKPSLYVHTVDDCMEELVEIRRILTARVKELEENRELYGKLHDHALSAARRAGIKTDDLLGQKTPVGISQIIDGLEAENARMRGALGKYRKYLTALPDTYDKKDPAFCVWNTLCGLVTEKYDEIFPSKP